MGYELIGLISHALLYGYKYPQGCGLKQSMKQTKNLSMGKCGLVLMVVLAAGLASGSAEKQLSRPGLEPIEDISDPKYQTLGQLVVEIHNWQNGQSHLQFQEVMCGWSEIVGGILYEFCLTVVDKDNNDAKVEYRTSVIIDRTMNIFIDNFHRIPNHVVCCLVQPEAKAKA